MGNFVTAEPVPDPPFSALIWQQRWWGIFLVERNAWLRDSDGRIVHYPLRSIAEAHNKPEPDSYYGHWEIREFSP